MSQDTKTRHFELKFKGLGLELSWKEKTWFSQLGLVLFGEGWASSPFREASPQEKFGTGEDAFGSFEEIRLLSSWQGRDEDGMEARKSPGYTAGLRFRFYEKQQSLVCHLLYEGKESLAAQGAAKVSLPLLYDFDRGLSAWRNSPWWTNPQFMSSPKLLGGPSQELLWQRGDGLYGLLLPLGGHGAKAYLSAQGGDFGVELASCAPGFKAAETPLFVMALGDDPYALNDRAFALASDAMGESFLTRQKKVFPEVFEGIGWCSWNTYYYEVDEAKLLASARSIADAKFPLRYMLVDDGWSSLKDDPKRAINPDKPWPGTGRMLWDFKEDPKKFPKGLKATIQEIKRLCGVRDVGLWHAFLGYWSYVHPESPLAKSLAASLRPSQGGGLVPKPARAKDFYGSWYSYLKEQGVSFLKVDDQASVQFAYRGLEPLQEAALGLENGLQDAAAEHFGNAVINCMAMSWENVSALKQGNVSRCSNDFLPTVHDNTPTHLVSNIYNAFWLSGLSSPDFDMFQSHHQDGLVHALLRSISGGPVYFTDTPGREDWALLRKLISADGRLLRADEPARPTRDVLLSDPLERPIALKAFTRVGKGGAVAAFNVFRGHESISARVKPSDVEGLLKGRYLIYEHFSGEHEILDWNESRRFELEPGGKKLFLFAPLEKGVAVVGLLDKFLSLRAIEVLDLQADRLRLDLRDSGRFGFYSERGIESVEEKGSPIAFQHHASGWCQIQMPQADQGPSQIDIRFKDRQ